MSGPDTPRRRRRRALPLVIGAVGLAALTAGQLLPVRAGVEADLEQRAAQALVDVGVEGAQVTFRGQDGEVTLRDGSSAAEVEAAVDTVLRVRGVRAVRVAADDDSAALPQATASPTGTASPTTTPRPTPTPTQTPSPTTSPTTRPADAAGPTVTVSRAVTGAVTLRGAVADATERAALIASVRPLAKAGLHGDLAVSPAAAGADDAADLAVLTGFLTALGPSGPAGSVTLERGGLVLTGIVADPDTRQALHAAAVAATGSEAAVRDTVRVDADRTRAAVADALDDLPPIRFSTKSSRLSARSVRAVTSAARILAANPGIRVEVGGHTDSVGSAADGIRLSERRADAVRDRLVEHGVDAARLVTVGYGENRLKRAEHTANDRAINRRVELHVRD